jgi:hypothetical protein
LPLRSLQRLVDALRIDEPWRVAAACAETSVNFFPRHVSTRTTMMAKAVCQGSAVKPECLAYPLEHDVAGVWGGTPTPSGRLYGAGERPIQSTCWRNLAAQSP